MSILGGGHRPNSTKQQVAMGLDLTGAQYGNCVTVVFGQNRIPGNVIWYGDFTPVAHTQKQSSGKGGGGGGGNTSYTYTASFLMGICEGVGTVVNVYDGTHVDSVAGVGGTLFTGTQGQAPWSHLTGTHAIGYSGTVCIGFQNKNLGDNPSLPNYSYEVAGRNQVGSGIVDANPADILTAICTDPQVGAGFQYLGDLTSVRNYWTAAGLFFSPYYDTQQAALNALQDILKFGNCDGWYSEGKLKIASYCDYSITGNGVTYTPTTSSVADLTSNDFITNGTSDVPVRIKRKSPADALNLVRLEYKDRQNNYRTVPVVASIDNDALLTGQRAEQSETADMITQASVGRLVAQNLVQRNFYVRNTYEFKLSWRYCYLEPFDVVTVTDANTGLNLFPVLITDIGEDEYGLLSVTAEEFPAGIGHGAVYSTQTANFQNVDANIDPGPVAGPYFFRAPGFLVSPGAPEIWVGVTGEGQYWGGCDVYLSQDGTNYSFLTTYARKSLYGYLTNTLPNVADPDTTSAPNVALNGGQLLGSSAADKDAFVTMAMVDTEVISYQTSTLQSGGTYTLGNLRRGGYGTGIATHNANAPFVRLDDNILRIPIDPSTIGQTIYVKFVSYNCFGRGPRTLASETAYTYVVGSNIEFPDAPVTPANFGTQGVADGVNVFWTNSIPAAVACTSVEYATASSGPWTVLAQTGPTDTSYVHHFTNGATYYYRARSRGYNLAAGWSAYTATFNSQGVNVSQIATNASNALNQANNLNMINLSMSQGIFGWTCSNSSDTANWYGETGTNGPNGGTSTYCVHRVSTYISQLNNTFMPCHPGQVIKAQGQVRGVGNPNAIAGIYIAFYDINKAYISSPNSNYVTGNVQETLYLSAVAPSNAAFVTIGPTCGSNASPQGYWTWANFWWNGQAATVDEVPDGSSYAKTLAAGVVNGVVPPQGAGKNMIGNPTFTSNAMGIAAGANISASSPNLCDGWQLYALSDPSILIAYENGSTAPVGFHPYFSFRAASMPNSTNWVAFVQAQQFGTFGGAVHTLYGQYSAGNTSTPPSGVLLNVRIAVRWFDATHTYLSETVVEIAPVWGSNETLRGNVTAPSGASYGIPYCGAWIGNYSGATYTISGLPLDVRITYFGVYAQASLDDEVADGNNYGRVRQIALNSGTGMPFTGAYTQNCVLNPNFAVNNGSWTSQTNAGTAALLANNWALEENDSSIFIAIRETGGSPSGGGSTNLNLRVQQSKAIGAGQVYVGVVRQPGFVPVNGRDSVAVSGYIWQNFNANLPTGAALSTFVGIDWCDATGAVISTSVYGYQRTGGNSNGTVFFQAQRFSPPSNAAQFRIACYVQLFNNQSGNAAWNTGTSLYGDCRFNAIRVVIAAQNQADLPQRTITNVAAKVPSSISYSATTTSATISAGAMTVLAGSISTAYGATSTTVSGTSGSTVTYYLYYNDPNYAGGSPTLVATTNSNDLYASDGYVNVGSVSVTFPTSGTSSGSGGGGGNGCVEENSWVWVKRGLLIRQMQAKDVRSGDYMRIMNPSTGFTRWGLVTLTRRMLQPCAHILTRKAVELVASLSAPIGAYDGRELHPMQLVGEQLLINRYGRVRLDKVAHVEKAGRRQVIMFTVEDDFFLCGLRPHEYLCHHNQKPP